jgi:peptidoglycan/xylan/chitin deacetylase (PgdA/CDA1 family)
MRVPILTYQPMVIHGSEYATNHLCAFAQDLRGVTEAGFRIVPLQQAIQAYLEGRGDELRDAVAFCVEDGTNFDYEDLPHPTAGVQRSVLNALRDFAAEHPGKQPALHATSFVIASPAARAELDRTCMLGQGWWTDTWWKEALSSGLMHVANHSWDHHHETLPEAFSLGVRRGTFRTIDSRDRADHEIRKAAEHLRQAAPNPGNELFAYPYGESNSYLVAEYLPRFAAELGIRAAFVDRPDFLEEDSPRWEIPRFMFGRDWSSPEGLQEILDRARAPKPPKAAAVTVCKPAAVRQPPWGDAKSLQASLDAPGRGRAQPGLVRMTLEISGGEPERAPHYQLVVQEENTGLRHVSAIDLSQGPVQLPLNVVGHLLTDGVAKIRVTLLQGERVAWSSACRFEVKNAGPLAETVRQALRGYGTPWLIEGLVDSSSFAFGNTDLRAWFDRPDALERIERDLRAGRITGDEATTLRQFVESGYAILPVAIEDALLRKLDRDLDHAIANHVDGYQYGTSQRVRNLHLYYSGVRQLWRHPAVMRYLQLIYDSAPRPCQTLTYIFGSQQGAHQDTIHLTPFPAGYMCGVWVALEDVKPHSGELEVYPGTHRLPRVYMNGSGCPKITDDDWSIFGDTVSQRWQGMIEGREKVTYRPKRGTVLIWHENLMHAGGVRIDESLSRRSIVSHYFADGAIAFYDSTGAAGQME